MAKPDKDELKFVADRLVERVWQGDEGKRGIATQAASVALAAVQDHTAARYMETADEFKGRDLMQEWINREAHASVALDKGDGETQSVGWVSEVDGVPVKHTPAEWSRLKGIIVRDPDGWRGDKGRPWTDAITEREFDQRVAISTVEDVKGTPSGEFPGWMRTGRFERRDAALERIVDVDRELLDRLAQEDWRDDL